METILLLLNIAKKEGKKGEYIDIALGKYKYPTSIKEVWEQFKEEQWQK